jgi:phosphatidylcholine synthase
VHLFTAMGAAAGLLAVIRISQHDWHGAFAWMAVAVLIDSADGAMARLVKVKDVLPGIDGALLDNIVDYFTYVIVPAYFIYEAPVAPQRLALFSAMVITVVSAYQFSQSDAKTPDHYFKGFPSYWNVLVFYLFLFQWPLWANFAILMACAVLVFVPLRYLYPSRTPTLRPLTWCLSLAWIVVMGVILIRLDHDTRLLRNLSLLYIAYYVAVSLYLNWRAATTPAAQEDPE